MNEVETTGTPSTPINVKPLKSCCNPETHYPSGLVTLQRKRPKGRRGLLIVLAGIAIWFLIYFLLRPWSAWVAYTVFGLPHDSRPGLAVEFFLFDAPKVLMLLTLVSFGVGVARSFMGARVGGVRALMTAGRLRSMLAGNREILGNILASGLGAFTPFCSCSAVPLFIGLVTSGVPLGVTFSFLISAPLVNEVALVLLLGLFGWRVAALYMGTGMLVAILAGWIIGRLRMEAYVQEWAYTASIRTGDVSEPKVDWAERIQMGLNSARDMVGKLWPYILIGIAIGAIINGYIPENIVASILGKKAWWSVPLAVLIGIPMYSNAAGILPVVQALLGKGAALGPALSFMMSVIGLSLPELILLRKVLKFRLIATFVCVFTLGILLVGYLFNFLF
ncbi:MAG TPA: permease [Blastocatellia bacterium]|nr:permease [Blastocatellia bacterium]